MASRLYATHRDMLVSYAGRLSGDLVGAEDIVQDAWLLMNRAGASAEIREPVAYIRRVIRNLVFAQSRRSRETVTAPAYLSDVVDDRPSAEAEMISRQAMTLVLEAIAQMPERQQLAIRMYHFEGMRLREVAAQLGLSISYTHSLIADGMEICDRRRRRKKGGGDGDA